MKASIISSALVITFLGIAATGYSQTKTPVIHQRQERQQRRIAQGVKSGELTSKETAHLEGREAKIQKDKKAAKADGVVTGTERRELRHEENRTSRAIRRQKHDAQVRH